MPVADYTHTVCCIYSTLQENQLALLDIWRNFVKHLCMQAGMHNNLGCQYQGES